MSDVVSPVILDRTHGAADYSAAYEWSVPGYGHFRPALHPHPCPSCGCLFGSMARAQGRGWDCPVRICRQCDAPIRLIHWTKFVPHV